MTDIWLGNPEEYFSAGKCQVPASKIVSVRPMEHADVPVVEKLIRPDTYEMFGDVNVGRIYEASCLSIVQCNEKHDVVSCMCLCNYPNVPSVIPQDWPIWLDTLYRLENVTESNAQFMHFFAWDRRYTGHFFEDLLTGLFDIASYLLHVLLVLPPRVIPGDIFEQQMIRMPSRCLTDTYSVQSLYMTVRHLNNPRLRIRGIVEEDNDDEIPIIDAETKLPKQFYGEYYISEMVRHPTDSRRLIVSDDEEGMATGVMFLNREINVDVLNEHFELGPYNGLRKPHEHDVIPPESLQPASETFFSVFSKKLQVETMDGHHWYHMRRAARVQPVISSLDQSVDDLEEQYQSSCSLHSIHHQPFRAFDLSQLSIGTGLQSDSDQFNPYYRSKIKTSVFADTILDIPRRSTMASTGIIDVLPSGEIQLPPRPTYHGKINVFAVEIFATMNHIKRRWKRNFLEAAFECLPDLDYGAVLLPFSHFSFPLLEYFVRVPLRCNRDYSMALYVTHRAALLGRIKTRKAEPDDRDEVQELLEQIPNAEKILVDFDEAMMKERPDMHCCVFQWNQTIIGLAIFCTEVDVTYITRRYHVEDYIATKNVPYDAYGFILHFVLMPIFSIHLHVFFSEIMRLSGLMVLYYRLTESALSALTRSQPLAICLNVMTLVSPRRRIEYKFSGYVETDGSEGENEYFSLFMTTPKLAMLGNPVIDTKIVVVGSSNCGIACVERLALGTTQKSMRFVNVTLISPNGLPFENERNPIIQGMIPFKGRYCWKYRRLIAARAWIDVVYGTVAAINRKDKRVTVLNQGHITYDYLILTCGLQYQVPRLQKELEAQKKGELLERKTPWNCLAINDDTEAALCLEKIQLLTSNFEDERKIILYGHNIDCYCALKGLLEAGIDGSWITLIIPPLQPCDTLESVFFNDCEVYTEVMNSISKSNVKIFVGWELIEWNLKNSTMGKIIESIVLRLKGNTRTIDCDALFNFSEKTINMKIFLAICRSGLVFDGQLVIDTEFKTNDPFVFAAGTVTKYRRKYYAESWQHKYFNSIEIGERLANLLQSIINVKEKVDTTPSVAQNSGNYVVLSTFRWPNIIACTLPGGYRYLHVRKPGKFLSRKIAIRYNFYGTVLMTGSSSSEIGYFRIRLNRYDSVETVTCLKKEDFELDHIITLYGKHESLLNMLKSRYQSSLITDFYAYFREPWAMVIFYDRFECLRIENRATLLSKTAIPGLSLVEDSIHALVNSKWEPMPEIDRRRIESRYAGSVYQQELEDSLLDLLQFAEKDIPVYCTPGKLCELYANIEDSPLYTDI